MEYNINPKSIIFGNSHPKLVKDIFRDLGIIHDREIETNCTYFSGCTNLHINIIIISNRFKLVFKQSRCTIYVTL